MDYKLFHLYKKEYVILLKVEYILLKELLLKACKNYKYHLKYYARLYIHQRLIWNNPYIKQYISEPQTLLLGVFIILF